MKPITPAEALKGKQESIPDVVFEVFNTLITNEFDGYDATLKEEDVVKALVAKGLKRDEVYNKHWLDVEAVYRKAGWKVDYDRSGYNETYPATYTFTTRRQ